MENWYENAKSAQKVYQSSAIDISLQEGAESDCANTEKVQQLLCPQDFSLQF